MCIIVLVHSGQHFNDYLNDCIDIINQYNVDIHLIVSSDLFNKIRSTKVKLIELESLADDRYLNFTVTKYNSAFNHGFWTKTSSRFILIDNYITKYNIESCFHIENDIAIFANLDNIKRILDDSVYDTALIMDAAKRCIPSLVWYKNKESSSRMSKFIYEHNDVNDMQNLASYFNNYRDLVTNLPIVPFDLQLHNINFGNLFNKFGCVFDGAAIGQYLYGTHNKPGISFINETTIFKASDLNISIIDKKPFIDLNNQLIPIINLHMHCKNLKQLYKIN